MLRYDFKRYQRVGNGPYVYPDDEESVAAVHEEDGGSAADRLLDGDDRHRRATSRTVPSADGGVGPAAGVHSVLLRRSLAEGCAGAQETEDESACSDCAEGADAGG